MSAIKGDFISFTYNGVHSTDLGIMRVTASNRYTDQLLPTIQDKTVQVPGGNGTYFFGSYYTQRAITINIAYDSVTEEQIRMMREIFCADAPHELIFDDEPYKVYYAKVNGTPQLTYIPFDSEAARESRSYDNGVMTQTVYERVYKGEGTLTFICYEPFAHCPSSCKYLDQWWFVNYTNKLEFGTISTDSGEPINSLFRLRTNDFIEINKDIDYRIWTNAKYYLIRFYKEDKTLTATNNNSGWKTIRKFPVIPEDAKYIKIIIANELNNATEPIGSNYKLFLSGINVPNWYNPSWISNSKGWKDGEWNKSAHLLNSNNGYDNNSNTNNNIFTLYNPGDVEADFELIMPDLTNIKGISVNSSNTLYIDPSKIKAGKFTTLESGEERHFQFNSKTNLIEELIKKNEIYRKTGVIFNEIITSGSWPKIPITGSQWDSNINGWIPKKNIQLKVILSSESLAARPTLNYDYLYY